MTADAITFGLAIVGYLLLAKDTALRLLNRPWPVLASWTTGVVLVHVLLVWALRFDWSLTTAWQKSAAGFLIFHFALLLICVAPFVRGRLRDRVTYLAFAIVSAGALPAPFRYPEVEALGVPMFAAFGVVVCIAVATRVRRRTPS